MMTGKILPEQLDKLNFHPLRRGTIDARVLKTKAKSSIHKCSV